MKHHRTLGITLLIVGVLLFGATYFVADSGFILFRKLFSASIFFICIGITFAIFTGKPLTQEQKKDKDNELKYLWTNAPVLHKIAWVVGSVGGFTLAQYYKVFLPE
jgi:uncharacterized membrane protein